MKQWLFPISRMNNKFISTKISLLFSCGNKLENSISHTLGGRKIVKTTQLIRKKVFILICINYMFRPKLAIIRYITDLRGVIYLCGGIDKESSCINFCYINIWCGYCIQYNNYFLSVTITNGGVSSWGCPYSLTVNMGNVCMKNRSD